MAHGAVFMGIAFEVDHDGDAYKLRFSCRILVLCPGNPENTHVKNQLPE